MTLSDYQSRVLVLLAERGTETTRRLARELGKPEASALMQSLADRGLVRTSGRCGTGKNHLRWTLTERGSAAANDAFRKEDSSAA